MSTQYNAILKLVYPTQPKKTPRPSSNNFASAKAIASIAIAITQKDLPYPSTWPQFSTPELILHIHTLVYHRTSAKVLRDITHCIKPPNKKRRRK